MRITVSVKWKRFIVPKKLKFQPISAEKFDLENVGKLMK